MELHFEFVLVGGAWDGVELPKPAWIDDGKTPCPERIFVGMCPVGMDCGSSHCRGGKRAHVSYWTADEAKPAGVVPYAKQNEHVARSDAGELSGQATYAIGGLLDPSNFGELARTPFGTVVGVEDDGTVRVDLGEPVTALDRSFAEMAAKLRSDFEHVSAAWRTYADGRHDRGWPH